MTKTTFAFGQLQSLMDRVLRLKEEQDAIGVDIKKVYAEAKSHGFDKTVMGLAVNRLRRIAKKGSNETEELDSMVDLYLAAYRGETVSVGANDQATEKTAVAPRQAPGKGRSPSPAHTREEIDPVTGEITDIENRTEKGAPHIVPSGAAGENGTAAAMSAGSPAAINPESPQDDPPVPDLAVEVADATPIASATDPEFDIGNIPAFLKRTPANDARAA